MSQRMKEGGRKTERILQTTDGLFIYNMLLQYDPINDQEIADSEYLFLKLISRMISEIYLQA